MLDDNRIILDVAHNPAAACFLAKQLAQCKFTGKIHAILGMLKDKDIAGTIKPMLDLIDTWYLADLHVPRGASAEDLSNVLKKFPACAGNDGEQLQTFTSVSDAYVKAVANCTQNDKIIVFGSFYTVAEILTRGS